MAKRHWLFATKCTVKLEIYNSRWLHLITIWKSLDQDLEKLRGERAEEVAKATFGTCQVLFEDVIDTNRCNRT